MDSILLFLDLHRIRFHSSGSSSEAKTRRGWPHRIYAKPRSWCWPKGTYP